MDGGRLQPVVSDNNDTRTASRPVDDKRLAEVEIDGKVSNETNQIDSRPVVDGDSANTGNQHPLGTVRSGDRLDLDSGKDTVSGLPVPATSTGNDEPFLLATGTDGNVVLPFRKRLPVQEPVLATSTGSVENKRVIIRPSDCPIWWEKLPEAAREYWHLYEWRGKYEHTKHQSGRIRVFVLYGPKWDKNTKELIRAGTGEFITGRVRPYDAFIPEETYQLLKDEGYEKK